MKIIGKAMKFGDNISTIEMAPLERTRSRDMEELKRLCMTAVRPTFPDEVKPGMIIVAGRNWGYGSHREQANTLFKEFGVKAIVAESIARIYYRNSIAIGLPAVICKGVSEAVNEGDTIEVDLREGRVTNLTTGRTLKITPLPPVMMSILEKGGILEQLKDELGMKKDEER
jgi:3-isopropylmalate/(R)-2-methylmalate dehydratase small subunit